MAAFIVQGCESSDFNLISDFFCSSQNPIFRLLMQFDCIEKHIFSGISDYFRLFLTDTLTPVIVWRCTYGMSKDVRIDCKSVYQGSILWGSIHVLISTTPLPKQKTKTKGTQITDVLSTWSKNNLIIFHHNIFILQWRKVFNFFYWYKHNQSKYSNKYSFQVLAKCKIFIVCEKCNKK